VTHATRLQKPLPATAATIDLAALILAFDTFFSALGFIAGVVTTFFNFVINLGLFFLGGL
jgi:hypothetical protein